MSYYYSDPGREGEPGALPNIEVFYRDETPSGIDEVQMEPGWYWWACFPGCMPDGDPYGPYGSEEEALADARDRGWEVDDDG
jgi:hypothetical protein